MACFSGPNIVNDGLVLHLDAANYKSYPGGNTVWNDISDSGENFTLYNNPTFSSDNNGELLFSGTNDYARIRNSNVINSMAANGSIELWIRSTSSTFGTAGSARLISFGDEARTGSDTGSTLGTNHDYNNFLCICRKSFGPIDGIELWYKFFPQRFGPAIALNTQEYFQVVVSWSQSGSNMTFRYYLNGVNTTTATLAQTPYSNGSTITIGQNGAGSLTSPFENSNCAYGNIKFYNKALSLAEVSQNFSALRGRYSL
jgi:hypothetical protein